MGFFQRVIHNTFRNVLPEYLIEQLIFELGVYRNHKTSQFLKKYKKYTGLADIKLNVGAGSSGKEGWVNIDAFNDTNISFEWDCRKSLPFKDNSVSVIFTEHFFEHIDYTSEAPVFLAECRRVLVPEGVIRIIVPDAELYLRAYPDDELVELSKIRPLTEEKRDFYSAQKINTSLELINIVFRQHYQHKYAYDYKTLEGLLLQSGFSKVQKQGYNQSMNKDLLLDMQIRESESLYVEAVK